MTKLDISVIIPLYNKEVIIERTIRSVLNQSFTNFELIIVNDGSTDNSFEIVKDIQDDRIVIINQTNGGPSKARNTGAKAAKADWIIFLDADDELLENALQIYAQLIEEHPNVDIIDCGQTILEKTEKKSVMLHSLEGISRNPLRDWFFHKIGPGSNHSVFKKKIVDRFPYNSQLRRFEDAELLIRMLQKAKVYSSLIPTSIVHCEYSSASKKRSDITEDYAGHLSMKGKSFWARMCVYRTYLENRELYPVEMRKLYPLWYYRYDLLLLFKVLNWFK